MVLENLNPSLFEKLEERKASATDFDNNLSDEIDEREVFDYIRHLQDPEHPLTLEELNVLEIDSVKIDRKNSYPVCSIQFTVNRMVFYFIALESFYLLFCFLF